MSIEIKNISKKFGAFSALESINLEIRTGELVALLGPSGSGKTTLLRIISGLETADSGQVLFHGEDSTATHVRKRGVGFVFQHYALFKHMTVFENVAFGLNVKPRKERPSKDTIRNRVYTLLKLVQMEGVTNRYPSQLSGGQRQRVALARALAVEPKVLLLDEPFGALDARVRQELREWLKQLHDEIQITSVFVTHDQEEALEVANRIVVMNKGRIEQVGSPDEVYEHPATPFVFNFLGNVNIFHGRARKGRTSIGAFEVNTPEHGAAGDTPVVGYVRPHDITVERKSNGVASIRATVLHIHPVGPVVRIRLSRTDNGQIFEAHLSKERFTDLNLKTGEQVFVSLNNMRVFVEDYAI